MKIGIKMKLVLSLFCVMLSMFCAAQKISVYKYDISLSQLPKEAKYQSSDEAKNTDFLHLVPEGDSLFHFIKMVYDENEKDYVLWNDIYDDELLLLESRKILLQGISSDGLFNLEGIFEFNGKPLIVYSQKDTGKDLHVFYGKILSFTDSMDGSHILYTLDSASIYSTYFSFGLSPDTKKCVIVASHMKNNENAFVSQVYIYDHVFEMVKTFPLKRDFFSSRLAPYFILTNNGELVCFADKNVNSFLSEVLPEIQPMVYCYKSDMDLDSLPLDFDGMEIKEFKLIGEHNGETLIAGSISDPMETGIVGLVLINLKVNELSSSRVKTQFFSNTVIDFFTLDQMNKDIFKGVPGLKFVEAHISEKGNMYALLSQERVEHFFNPNQASYPVYYSDSKIIVKWDQDFNMIFEKVIPNRTKSVQYQENLHCVSFLNGEKISVVYNTHIKNLTKFRKFEKNLKIKSIMTNRNFKDNLILLTEFDTIGNFVHSPLLPKDNHQMALGFNTIYYKNNQIYSVFRDKKRHRLFKGKLNAGRL